MAFISLSVPNGDRVDVNVDHIVSIGPAPNNTTFITTTSSLNNMPYIITVAEAIDLVKGRIDAALSSGL